MKSIEIDDDLYAFVASQTKHIGESASEILRRLLLPEDGEVAKTTSTQASANDAVKETASQSTASPKPAVANSNSSKVAKSTTSKAKKDTPSATVNTASSTSTPDTSAATHNKDDIVDMVSDDALATFTKRVDQFLFILSAAHKLNAENFMHVESIVGKNRTYFATSKEALLQNGSSTNPKAIPDSDYWVVTNNNTAKKVSMLEQVLRKLGYAPDVVETIVSRFAPEGK